MSHIFICYRRNDSAGHAGWLENTLVDRFGKSRVYMDIDSIPAGTLWEEELQRALAGASAALVIIGQHWLSPVHRGRLHSPDDHVRQEISRALKTKGVRVIPVRVHGAEMPKAHDLPEDIRGLLKRQGVVLHDGSFKSDVQKLIRQLESLPGLKSGGAAKRPRKVGKNKSSGDGTSGRKGSAPGVGRVPRTTDGAPRGQARPASSSKSRAQTVSKQPTRDQSHAEATKAANSTTTQSKRSRGQRTQGTVTTPANGRRPTAKKTTTSPPARADGQHPPRQGGATVKSAARRVSAAQNGSGAPPRRGPKQGGGSTPKQPAKKTTRPRSGNPGGRRG